MERYGLDQWTAKPSSVTSTFRLSLSMPKIFFESDRCGFGWGFSVFGETSDTEPSADASLASRRPITAIRYYFKPIFINSIGIKNLGISVFFENLQVDQPAMEQWRSHVVTLPLEQLNKAPRTRELLGSYHPPDGVNFSGDQMIRFKVTFSDTLGFSFPNTSVPWMHRVFKESVEGHEPVPVDTKIYLFHRRSARQRRTQPKVLYASSGLLSGESTYFDSLFENEFKEAIHVDLDSHSFNQIDSGDGLYDFTDSDSDLDFDSDDEKMVEPPDLRPIQSDSSHDLKPDDMPTFTTEDHIETLGVKKNPRLGRVVFIKDGAFKTWKCFIAYLYTKEVAFESLRSENKTSRKYQEIQSCSPKSMYRLADKAGMKELQDLAFRAIHLRLTETNIVEEVFTKFTSLFPKIQELEADFLVSHYSSGDVAMKFRRILQDVAAGHLPHSVDVLNLIFEKMHMKASSS